MVGQDEPALYTSVIEFLRRRPNLRRLDLGSCPWHMVLALLRGKPQLQEESDPFPTGDQESTSEAASTVSNSDPIPISRTSFGAAASFSSGPSSTYRKRTGKERAPHTVGIPGLRTLGVRMGNMTEVKVRDLVSVLPREMVAIGLWAGVCDRSMASLLVSP